MNLKALADRHEKTGRLPTIYVCGPMSGLADLNFPAFNETARKLRLFGFPVINPADFGPGESAQTRDQAHQDWTRCLARDLPLVAAADMLILLDGWEHSRGACLEFDAALAFKKPMVEPSHGDDFDRFVTLFFDEDAADAVVAADEQAEAVRKLILEGQEFELIELDEEEDDADDEGSDDDPEAAPTPGSDGAAPADALA